MDSITQLRISVKVRKYTIDIMIERPTFYDKTPEITTWMGVWLIREWIHDGTITTEPRLIQRVEFALNELPYDSLSEELKERIWSGLLQVDELQ